jgi:26S proteasome regulatory subunit N2
MIAKQRILNNAHYLTVGVIALLDEPNVLLKEFALQKLNEIVDEFWPEIADSVEKM